MRLALLFVCSLPARAPPSVFRSIRGDIMEIEPGVYPLIRVFCTRLFDDDGRVVTVHRLDSPRAWARVFVSRRTIRRTR